MSGEEPSVKKSKVETTANGTDEPYVPKNILLTGGAGEYLLVMQLARSIRRQGYQKWKLSYKRLSLYVTQQAILGFSFAEMK